MMRSKSLLSRMKMLLSKARKFDRELFCPTCELRDECNGSLTTSCSETYLCYTAATSQPGSELRGPSVESKMTTLWTYAVDFRRQYAGMCQYCPLVNECKKLNTLNQCEHLFLAAIACGRTDLLHCPEYEEFKK